MSSEDVEISEGGSKILRHQLPERPDFVPAVYDETPDLMSQLLEERYGKDFGWVYHEIVSDTIHLDIYVVKPNALHNYYTLYTGGVSSIAMNLPPGSKENPYIELVSYLPSDWDFETLTLGLGKPDISEQVEQLYWPILWLKNLGRLPSTFNTWLGYGHTIPSDEELTPFSPNTKLCCFLMLPPQLHPQDQWEIKAGDKTVSLLFAFPIYKEEMDLKLRRGMDALLDLFEQYETPTILNMMRPNVCTAPTPKRKKFLGLF